jgi:hypothetical protein
MEICKVVDRKEMNGRVKKHTPSVEKKRRWDRKEEA